MSFNQVGQQFHSGAAIADKIIVYKIDCTRIPLLQYCIFSITYFLC
ncbi:MAG: hypothetical protein AB4426_13540 [Xenococcaceae cyanobacterium]